ncbi:MULTISPECIES: glycerate kinase [Nocardioides]|uniref:Glycerate kinase n=1 Tax=Nocardioides vastitatis TaxID=2568655 RepID=A0ABW0ZHJ9_9ACTN|nr:glycerate kinase [Nocardioides sp.]THI96955.1 glycerate kinase [Nocardioides sp.]
MPTVLIASDKFKGSLTAAEVGDAVARGVRRARSDVTTISQPVADGGDGTLAAALAAGYELVPVVAAGPTGRAVRSGYARRGDTAVVELADVAGLVRLADDRFAPMTATSRGAGELIAAAVDAGCTRIVLGIGGSASTDGGSGLLRALGAVVLDTHGREIGEGGAGLDAATAVDLTALRRRMSGVDVVVACDVDNPLTGPRGAAAVYGPQKGADGEQVTQLEAALDHWADVVADTTGDDQRQAAGAGAAGGVGFAALALLDARLQSGIELVLDMTGFHEHLARADLVVTGEGALDEQTLNGKAVAGVAAAARAAGIPVVAVCGRNLLDAGALATAGIQAAYALNDVEPDLDRCLAEGDRLLPVLGERIAASHLAGSSEFRRTARQDAQSGVQHIPYGMQ